jgi:hypothetical protein
VIPALNWTNFPHAPGRGAHQEIVGMGHIGFQLRQPFRFE